MEIRHRRKCWQRCGIKQTKVLCTRVFFTNSDDLNDYDITDDHCVIWLLTFEGRVKVEDLRKTTPTKRNIAKTETDLFSLPGNACFCIGTQYTILFWWEWNVCISENERSPWNGKWSLVSERIKGSVAWELGWPRSSPSHRYKNLVYTKARRNNNHPFDRWCMSGRRQNNTLAASAKLWLLWLIKVGSLFSVILLLYAIGL